MVRSCPRGKHRARRLSGEVLWCSRCGSYRRLMYAADGGAQGWSRWVPCGVERLPPLQLELPTSVSSVSLEEMREALERLPGRQLELIDAIAPPTAPAAKSGKPTLRIVK